jgi:hypothetical protein
LIAFGLKALAVSAAVALRRTLAVAARPLAVSDVRDIFI